MANSATTLPLPKPTVLAVKPEGVPDDLKLHRCWVTWKLEWDGTRWTKVPYQADGRRKGSSTNAATWRSYDEALAAYQAGGYDGIGFVFNKEIPRFFLDLDHCHDPETGAIEAWAEAIIESFIDTCVELSPSATGLRVIGEGALPEGSRKKRMDSNGGALEMYDTERFGTITGHTLEGTSLTITNKQDAVDALHGLHFPKKEAPPASPRLSPNGHGTHLDDQTLLKMARSSLKVGAAFSALYDRGDLGNYGGDHSGGDLGLVNHLLWFSNGDVAQVDRLFRASALMRPEKWDRKAHRDGRTYGQGTIDKALSDFTGGYIPPAVATWPTITVGGKVVDGEDHDLPPVGTVIEGEIPTPPPAAGRVNIKDGNAVYLSAQDQHTKEVTRQAWDAICGRNDPPSTFMYANRPTRLVIQADGTPTPEPLDERKLAHLAARAVVWYRSVVIPKSNPVEYEHRYAHPPLAIIRDMLEETGVALPTLSRIVQAPAYAPDGSLSLDPGYHAPSESYYVANGLVVPPVPSRPTAQQIDDARDLIDNEVFGDFPFVDDADRAHAFAMLLQAFVRSCISGTTPLYMINKPKAGTGATLLAQIVALITSGQPSATMTQARSDDEMRKRITSTLRRMPPQILLDNVRGTLDDPSLASVLTARVWGDRILGESNNVEIPVSSTFVATGNNIGMSDEIARRSVPIRLDAQVERPDARGGWRHDHIEEWVIEHRGELVAACLTLCQAWFAASRPKPTNAVRLGGYESWSRVMGGILEVGGLPGFLSNLRQFRDRADVTTDVTKAFLERWWTDRNTTKVLIKDLIPAATDVGVDLGKVDNERSLTSTLGRFVKRLEGQIYTIEDDQLVRVADAGKDRTSKSQLWMLEEPVASGTSGTSGTSSDDTRTTSKDNPKPTETSIRTGPGSSGSSGSSGDRRSEAEAFQDLFDTTEARSTGRGDY